MRHFNIDDLLTPLIGPIIPFNIKIFIFTNKGSKNMYNLLNKTNVEPTGKHKWNRIFFLQDLEWKQIYRLPFYCTQNSKLQWFQYRLNHHIVVTNKFLFKIGKSDSQMCTFCDTSEESILHLLWECPKTQKLINDFAAFCNTYNVLFNPNSKTFLFGMLPLKDASKPYNSILMTVKYYIYKSKCFNNVPDMFGLLKDMKNLYITSKIISIKNGRYHWFETHWNTWSFLEDC